jgi:hypothetical protein
MIWFNGSTSKQQSTTKTTLKPAREAAFQMSGALGNQIWMAVSI